MKIKVNLNPGYEIEIRKGSITNEVLPTGFVITDKNIIKHYGSLLTDSEIMKLSYIIGSGEDNKSLKNYNKIIEKISGLEHADRIIALGGGVVGDLSGFVASTCKRGIPLIHVPTTLLAMVDSSIGGKNGVNVRKIKNYVGTIYQPEEVLIDPLFLETLPEREFRNGLAEVVKYAHLFRGSLLDRLQQRVLPQHKDIESIIYNSCKNKVNVVEKDEFDKDYRHCLNFGHTIGHAIELPYGLSHGEAISIGMVKELELANNLGIVKSKDAKVLKNILEIHGLPTEFPRSFNPSRTLNIMKADKKGKFVFAFDCEHYKVQVDEETIREFLENA